MENNEIILKAPDCFFANQLLDYCKRNNSFLAPYSPIRPINFLTLDFQANVLLKNREAWDKDDSYTFYIFEKENNLLIGHISLSNIVRGAFQSCFMGYGLDKDYLNKGYMSFAVKQVVNFAFTTLKLHRIEANVMPRNMRSLKVLQKNGFNEEGLAKKYLKINGKWEDHVHMVILNESL
ncbi:MAG: GNAT family N-acetyltransferase [Pleomorphochaeta sp.]